MTQRTFFAVMLLSAVTSICSAGTLNKGIWAPSGCGNEPAAPQLNQTTEDNFNKSVKLINDWQDKAKVYNECVIKEANDDNASIAKVANEKQNKLKATADKIRADTEAAKAKLEGK